MRPGQPATTLSGGEAQRIKLATELSRRATGRTMYILDEPPPACTSPMWSVCFGVLQRLVDAGNTVVVIEHNLDVIKSADWLIDLGPEGGDAGGQVLTGTPEDVAETNNLSQVTSSSDCSLEDDVGGVANAPRQIRW